MPVWPRSNIDAVEATKLRVLAIGLIAGSLILWLAGSFWFDAWSQFQQARETQSLIKESAQTAADGTLRPAEGVASPSAIDRLQATLYRDAHPTLTHLLPYLNLKQHLVEFDSLANQTLNDRPVSADPISQGPNPLLAGAINAERLQDKHRELVNYINAHTQDSKAIAQHDELLQVKESVETLSTQLLGSTGENNSINNDVASLRSALAEIDASASDHILQNAEAVESHALRRMLIDTLLIAICLWIGYSSQRLLGHIHNQAYYDRRTNLPNRFKLQQLMDQNVATTTTDTKNTALSIIEINDFDQINDSYGKAIGDKLLHSVGERFAQNAGPNTHVATIGDNRFAILFDCACTKNNAKERTQNLIESSETAFNIDGANIHPKLRAGMSYSPEHGLQSDELLQKSELAMTLANSTGKDRLQIFSDQLSEQHKSRVQLEIDLRIAVEEEQFSLHYQPKVCTKTGEVHSVEALVRWEHPTRGMVSPFHFISVAEQCGLIDDIGGWVMNEAIRQTVCWHQKGLKDLQVAINVSAYQFLQVDFIEQVIQALKRHGLPESALELEITESVAMLDVQQVIAGLTQLRSAGIRIAIDDFGTDYSSLKVLDDLPVDVLKIDRSFVTRLDKMDHERSLANTIVHMAKSLGLKTVAEGVESEEQMEKIRKIGCDYIQGYYYAKPVAADCLEDTIKDIASRPNSSINKVA